MQSMVIKANKIVQKVKQFQNNASFIPKAYNVTQIMLNIPLINKFIVMINQRK